jgi:DNA-binding CsgD family transcriptional regulator
MNVQSMQISLPKVNDRRATGFQSSIGTTSTRAMRRSEAALMDGMQAWVRSGHGLAALIGTNHPGPSFTYDLPVLRAAAPLLAMPYGLLTELLTNVSKMLEARAVWRAAAHTLSLNLLDNLADNKVLDWDDHASPAGALLQLLSGLAETTPLVIHLEGLHRADEPSLKLLREAALQLAHRPILFVGVYRADLPYAAGLNEMLNQAAYVQADFSPAWADDVAVFLDVMFGRHVPLNMMIEAARNDDRLLLLGGVPLLEACRRMGRWTEGLTLSERVITTAQLRGAEYVAAAARLARCNILIGLGQWADAQIECDTVIKSPVCAHDRNLTATAVWGGYKARVMSDLPARHLLDALKRWRTHIRNSDDPAIVAPLVADLVVHFAQSDQLHEAKSWQSDLEALLDHSNHPATRLAVALGQGALAVRHQDWRAATGAYRAAIDHAAQQHDLLLEARAASGLAFVLLESGDTESKNEGRERLSVAHSVLSRLNARPDMETCEAGAKQFGLRPRQRRPTSSNRTPGALTRREREVLALIVNGMTNRQIAQRLTISEKTAEGHVGNILAKLSCSSRIKAAELARATGLLEGSMA